MFNGFLHGIPSYPWMRYSWFPPREISFLEEDDFLLRIYSTRMHSLPTRHCFHFCSATDHYILRALLKSAKKIENIIANPWFNQDTGFVSCFVTKFARIQFGGRVGRRLPKRAGSVECWELAKPDTNPKWSVMGDPSSSFTIRIFDYFWTVLNCVHKFQRYKWSIRHIRGENATKKFPW